MSKKNTAKKAKIQMKLRRLRFRGLFEAMLLKRSRLISVIFVVIGAIVAAVIVMRFVFFAPQIVAPIVQDPPVRLETDLLDELELFIETRQTTYENPPQFSEGIFR